jgi:hypothetical protein
MLFSSRVATAANRIYPGASLSFNHVWYILDMPAHNFSADNTVR